eukprot:1993925-Pyramimonas_sp.AAC.1
MVPAALPPLRWSSEVSLAAPAASLDAACACGDQASEVTLAGGADQSLRGSGTSSRSPAAG